MLSSFFSTSSYFSSAAPPRVRQLATLPNRARGVTRLREWYGWPENVSAVSCIVHIVGAARSEEGNRNYRNKVNQTVRRTRTTTFNNKYLKRTTATRTPTTTITTIAPINLPVLTRHSTTLPIPSPPSHTARTLTHVEQSEAHTTCRFCEPAGRAGSACHRSSGSKLDKFVA